ncbi:MAG: hypothetical protein ACKVH8_25250, partial [Pirellulales bacterium]
LKPMPQYDGLTQLWGALLANAPPYIYCPDSKKVLSSFCRVLAMFMRRIFLYLFETKANENSATDALYSTRFLLVETTQQARRALASHKKRGLIHKSINSAVRYFSQY